METSTNADPYPSGQLILLLIDGISAPTAEMWFAIIIFFSLLALSGMVSASEVAFFSLNAKDTDDLTEKEDTASMRVIDLLNRPRYLLATILILNNLVNVAIVVLSYFIISRIIDFGIFPIMGFVLNVVGVTFMLVMFGEVLPKIYASRLQMKVAYFMSLPLIIARSIFKPVSYLLVTSTKFIEARLNRRNNDDISLEELEHAIELTADTKSGREEIDMLKGIVKFGNTSAKQIMHARVNVFAVEENTPYDELLKKITEAGYSRVPVFKDSMDNIIGVLYVKDLLGELDASEYDWKQHLRQPYFVPETKKINELLKDMQISRNHLTIVVDEYGGVSGIITLEDILEEVIGDINDEYDEVASDVSFVKIDDNNYVFEGKTNIKDVCKTMNIREERFDEVRGDADSLGGLLLEITGKFPKRNDSITFENFIFRALDIHKNRIKKVKVTLIPEEE